MARQDLAAIEQLRNRGGNANLTRLAAKFGDARVEWFCRALERIHRQCPGSDRGLEHALTHEEGIERE